VKKLLAAFLISALAASNSYGATTKPTAKPATKSTIKPTTKSATKTAAKSKSKVSIAKKPAVKRKVYVRKRVKPSPSPKPVWPPKGFIENNGVFARIPSGTELVGLLSAKTTLQKIVVTCEASACGAVYIASATDCTWWEITANVFGPSYADITNYVQYGSLRTLIAGTSAHTVTPVFLVSSEPLIPNEDVILQTLGLKREKFYNQIALGQSLRQIAGSKINAVVSAVAAAERKDIAARLASGAITSAQAQDQTEGLPARVSNELTSYNLTVGGINVKCWISSPTETIPSTTYTALTNR
jgi:hypothetical protein